MRVAAKRDRPPTAQAPASKTGGASDWLSVSLSGSKPAGERPGRARGLGSWGF
jgi:hypothetical protein